MNNNNEEEQENLRLENEIKRIKLTLETGATFNKPENESNLPPEVEADFLDYISKFEKEYAKNIQISIFDFIGKPNYRKADELSKEEISEELKKITEVMQSHEMRLDTICEYEDEIIYRFITEELFAEEMNDMRIPGMMHCYIYEEFHPNHEYDIKSHSTEFINCFLDKNSDYYTTFTLKEPEESNFFKNFRDSYKSFSLHKFDIVSIKFDKENAKVFFQIDFSGNLENGEEFLFTGEGNFSLVYKYDFWCIAEVNFPK